VEVVEEVEEVEVAGVGVDMEAGMVVVEVDKVVDMVVAGEEVEEVVDIPEVEVGSNRFSFHPGSLQLMKLL